MNRARLENLFAVTTLFSVADLRVFLSSTEGQIQFMRGERNFNTHAPAAFRKIVRRLDDLHARKKAILLAILEREKNSSQFCKGRHLPRKWHDNNLIVDPARSNLEAAPLRQAISRGIS